MERKEGASRIQAGSSEALCTCCNGLDLHRGIGGRSVACFRDHNSAASQKGPLSRAAVEPCTTMYARMLATKRAGGALLGAVGPTVTSCRQPRRIDVPCNHLRRPGGISDFTK